VNASVRATEALADARPILALEVQTNRPGSISVIGNAALHNLIWWDAALAFG
jgi:hypothetical protein